MALGVVVVACAPSAITMVAAPALASNVMNGSVEAVVAGREFPGVSRSGSAPAPLLNVPQASPSPTVKSAGLSVTQSGPDELTIVVTNHGKVAIEAWLYAGGFETTSGESRELRRGTETFRWRVGNSAPPPGDGPIQPGEARRIVHTVADLRKVTDVHLVMVLFVDFTSEGDPVEVKRMLDLREREGTEAAKWIAVLDDALRLTPDRARTLLASRTRPSPAGDLFADSLRRLVQEVSQATDGELSARAAAARRHLVSVRDAALRHKKGIPPMSLMSGRVGP